METSLDFARVMGPVILIMGLSLAFNQGFFVKMARNFMDSPALIFLAGFITLLLGLIVVAFHNVWVMGWPVFITLFGWIMVIVGIIRMNFADKLKKLGEGMLKSRPVLMGAALLYAAIGALLTFKGWLA